MKKIKFACWDRLNSEYESAVGIDSGTPEEAARRYAEQDSDGQLDGCYDGKDGHDIMVLNPHTMVTYVIEVRGVVEIRFEAVIQDVTSDSSRTRPSE